MQPFEKSSIFNGLAVATISLGILASCALAQNQSSAVTHISPATGQTLSAHYLAGRFAQRQQDWKSADAFIGTASAFDPDNSLLQQRAFLLAIGAGNVKSAVDIARAIHDKEPDHELSNIYLACDALRRADYATAQSFVARLPEDGFGIYTKPLLTAWILAGQGKHDDALALITTHGASEDASYNMHAALIMERAGKIDDAKALIDQTLASGLTVHNALTAADFYLRQDDVQRANDIYAGIGSIGRLQADKISARPKPLPVDGAAIVLMDLASILYERRSLDSAQIYGNIALMLAPDYAPTLLMLGDIALTHEKYGRAIENYAAIQPESPFSGVAGLRSAEALLMDGKDAQGVALLKRLSINPLHRVAALSMLGDAYRQRDDMANALASYDSALAHSDTASADAWPLLYARGMVLERMNDWDRAEKDLMSALKFQPNNPMILNYIGYSWAEKGVNLDRAEEFLSRAVALSPNDGYILDSYGWVLYRLGRYDEAAQWLEKAVGLVPDDSAILSHAGDAFWHTGRQAEARFKWKRALDISQDGKVKDELRQKIAHGVSPEKSFVARGDE
jgi:tetratricopeptide (TPR) repeat protein